LQFDATAAQLEDQIGSLETLADQLESVGGDVADARVMFEEASGALAQARELEAQSVAQFETVLDSENRRSAFVQARQTAQQAVAEMHRCRTVLRQSAVELGSVARDLYAGVDDE
jgi:ABC-type transporter Mla subunit MlaD